MMHYAGDYQARDPADVASRRRRLSENFVSQVIRDPRTVFEAIWTRLTHDAGHNQQLQILERLEDAIARAACVPGLQQPVFKLELRHTCQASGCGNPHCSLCRGNPSRACTQPISPRNLVDTELKSQCGARVEAHVLPLRPEAGHMLPPFRLQVCVVEKNHCNEAAWQSLPNVALLTYRRTNQEVNRLLCISTKSADAPMGHMHPDNFVYFPTPDAKTLGSSCTADKVTVLPDLILKASGESVVKSKLPDLALAIRAVDLNLQPLDHLIQPVFSNFFQVATKRTKSNMKVEIPFITTEVSKIEGIGAETKSKLSDLANLMGPGYSRIDTVGDLRVLINGVQQDDAERARLLKALKMNKESWEVVVAHVHKAVEIDNRMRVFTRCVSVRPRRDVGLVFLCDRGSLQAHQDGLQGFVERMNGRERFVRWRNLQQMYDVHTYCLASLLEEAQCAWAEPNHPGWDFFRPHGLEIDCEDALPCDGSSPNGVRYLMAPGCAPAYGHDGLDLPPHAPPALDNDGDAEMASPPTDFPALEQLTEVLRNTAPATANRSASHDGQRAVGNLFPAGAPGASMPPLMDQPPPLPPADAAFLEELINGSIFTGTAVPPDGLSDLLNNSYNAAGQSSAAESVGDVARGITRFTRSFNYTKSSSFRMPAQKRLNHLTSSDLEKAVEAEQPSDLRLLEQTPSWQADEGADEAGPSHLHELDGPADHRSFPQPPPRCFHTGEERVDDGDVQAKMELQQISMEFYQNVLGPDADNFGGSNPFFPANDHETFRA